MSENNIDLDGPLVEVKKQVESVMKAVKESQESNDENLKKHDALTEEKVNKINDFVTKKLDEIQTGKIEQEARIKDLEAALNRAEQGGEDTVLAEKRAKAMSEFMRNKSQNKLEIEILDEKQAEAKAMSTDVGYDGGFIVRPEFGDFVVSRIFETSPLRSIANVETIGKKSLELIIDDDEADANNVSEGGTISETDTPEIGLLEITAHKYYADPKVTEEMLEDGEFDVESWLMNKVARKIGRKENTDFITGNGVGKAKGITAYSDWTTAGTYERGKLEQFNSGAAAALQADGLIDLQNGLIEDYQANATWVMRRATFGAIMKLKDGNSNYLFNMALDNNTGLPTMNVLTRPVLFAADMPAVAANALAIAYGDFSEGYTIVDRRGIMVLRDPYSSKGYVEFYTTKRTGGAVTNFDAIKIQKVAA